MHRLREEADAIATILEPPARTEGVSISSLSGA